jgi:hypothetical protein
LTDIETACKPWIRQTSNSTIVEARRFSEMSDTQTAGGFAGDPSEALTAVRAGGCCGNRPENTLVPSEPAEAAAPCCGTATDAAAEGACCGGTAKAEAVASGQDCCG